MRFIIELDGPIFDVMPVRYVAHRAVAAEVGWSRLDEATFRRRMRTKGRDADILPGATNAKVAEYDRRFAVYAESDASVGTCQTQPGVAAAVRAMVEYGPCCAVTLGSNVSARRALLDRAGLAQFLERTESLDTDPRRRPAELRTLSAGDDRTIVVAATASLVRSVGGAELFGVGLSCGTTAIARLHQAGADIVYKELQDIVVSLKTGAKDLIRAGLLPPPLE